MACVSRAQTLLLQGCEQGKCLRLVHGFAQSVEQLWNLLLLITIGGSVAEFAHHRATVKWFKIPDKFCSSYSVYQRFRIAFSLKGVMSSTALSKVLRFF